MRVLIAAHPDVRACYRCGGSGVDAQGVFQETGLSGCYGILPKELCKSAASQRVARDKTMEARDEGSST